MGLHVGDKQIYFLPRKMVLILMVAFEFQIVHTHIRYVGNDVSVDRPISFHYESCNKSCYLMPVLS